jgi:predicted aldo/keto reductase-like oxidoreductase
MRYREFGRNGGDVSALGFGCMRLPTTDGVAQSEAIDEAATVRLIRRAVDEAPPVLGNFRDRFPVFSEERKCA